ncbi:hypothetical protein D0Y65_019456 [Glycine soja]|uniref:Reverse transcriptase domain-containing protein n=1 Tax=Glycine soja TaxID=3848 RepID=A0A445J9G2_GLYSO|nr:hypothetical protein D0Y65_019456 [Glycine soja]
MLEPRVSGVRADNIISKAGLNASFKVDVIGFSGGILLMWNKDVYDVKVLESDIQYIHCDVRDNNGASFLFTVVYGSPNMAMRDKLWVSLCRIDASVRGPWIFILKRALAAAFPRFLRWTLINIIQGQLNDCEIKEAIFATGALKEINSTNPVLIPKCDNPDSMAQFRPREKTETFGISKGIRQRDPLSPYIFVLCVECLTHLVQMAQGFLTCFSLTTFSFVAKANIEKMDIILNCLDTFSKTSGENSLWVSKNVNQRVEETLSEISGFSLTSDLERYLGVPLLHRRNKIERYNIILDYTQKRLSDWRAYSLSFSSRVTLVKAVISVLQTYTMQSVLLPIHDDLIPIVSKSSSRG